MENESAFSKKLFVICNFWDHWVYLEEPPHFTLPTQLHLSWHSLQDEQGGSRVWIWAETTLQAQHFPLCQPLLLSLAGSPTPWGRACGCP